MSTEQLLLLSALVDLCFVFVAARAGEKWLFGTIAVNLILISIFGAKLIEIFGIVTNVGNIFYACVFFATHLLLERQSKEEALRTIWFGSAFVVFFLSMSALAVSVMSYAPNDSVQTALQNIFAFSPRVVLASLLAYIFAQYVNIRVYAWLQKKTNRSMLWFRSNVANILSQGVDSSIFFTIAFLDLPGVALLQAIAAGWAIKVAVVGLGTPLLYVDQFLSKKKQL